jgi:hypothetical protein
MVLQELEKQHQGNLPTPRGNVSVVRQYLIDAEQNKNFLIGRSR